MNHVDCGLRDEEHTVAEWLSEFNLQESEVWFLEWSKVLGEIALLLIELEKVLSPKLMESIFNAVFIGMYLQYAPFGSFMDQFRANTKKIVKLLTEIKNECVKHSGGGEK